MRIRLLSCLLAVLLLAGCTAKPAQSAAPSVTLEPTPSPSATPSPTPEETDIDETDEADFYFDFGQDDLIALAYEVSWPEAEMPGWTVQSNSRVGALLTLQNGESTLTVLLEDAPDLETLDAFLDYSRELLAFSYEDITLSEVETNGDYRTLTGQLADRPNGLLDCWYTTLDGLYLTAELVTSGDEAQTAQETFENTFMPALNLTFNGSITDTNPHEEE